MNSEAQLIKSRILPSEIIRKKVNLKSKGGTGYVGLCPFHKEKTPSFFVNDDKKIYHCFGCGAHGDIFTFIMQDEGISYKDALEKLANIAGVKLKINSRKEIEQFEKNKIFFQIYKKTAEFYQKQLFNQIGDKALSYITSRGIKLEFIKKYHLGYSPNDSSILLKELKKEFSESEIYESKIIYKKNNFEFDPLYNRLIFPIQDKLGNFIAFGGRIVDKGEPKYLNSAENPIFKKSEHLYGYNFAKNSIYKQQEAIVVEGYMDVISLANCGIKNTVAPLGTSIKLEQLEILWSICQEPTICFDNDEAGKNAAKKIAYNSLTKISHNKSLKFVNLIEGKDPDDVIKNKGVNFFKNLIEKNISLSDYIFNNEVDKFGINTPERKTSIKLSLEKIVEDISDYSLKKSYLYHFKKKYSDLVFNFKKKIINNTNNATLLKIKKQNNTDEINNTIVIAILCNYPDLLKNNKITEELMNIKMPNKLDNIKKILLDFSLSNDDNFKSFFDNNIEKIINKNEATEIIEKLLNTIKFKSQAEAKQKLLRVFNINKIGAIKKEIEELKNQLLSTADDKLMKKMIYLKEYERQIKDEMAN